MAKKKSTKKEKTFTIRKCPKCGSSDVGIKIGGKGDWECHKCNYFGSDFKVEEVSEEEFLSQFDFDESVFDEPQTVEEKKSHKELLKEKLAKGEEI
jgi:transcription elongation factor Elf1